MQATIEETQKLVNVSSKEITDLKSSNIELSKLVEATDL